MFRLLHSTQKLCEASVSLANRGEVQMSEDAEDQKPQDNTMLIVALVGLVLLGAILAVLLRMHINSLDACDRLEWSRPLSNAAAECRRESIRRANELGQVAF